MVYIRLKNKRIFEGFSEDCLTKMNQFEWSQIKIYDGCIKYLGRVLKISERQRNSLRFHRIPPDLPERALISSKKDM